MERANYDESLQQIELGERGLASASGAVMADRIEAQALRAAWLSRKNRFDEAIEHYETAIRIANEAAGALERAEVDIRLDFVDELVKHRRGNEAKAHLATALATMRASGGSGDITAALAEAQAASLLAHKYEVSFEEAGEMVQRARASVGDRTDLPLAISAVFELCLGQINVWSGRVEEGYPLLARAAAVLRPSTEAPQARLDIVAALGFAEAYFGKYQEAEAHLREALELAKLLYGASDPKTSGHYFLLAGTLMQEGRHDEADAILDTLPLIEPARGVGEFPTLEVDTLFSLRAAITLARGDFAGALRRLPTEGVERPAAADGHRLVRGEALCELGQRKAGLIEIETYLKGVTTLWYKYDPDVARARAVAGLCALKAGNRARASELATLARDALANQPNLATYFKAPAERLDQALGRSRPSR